MKPFNPAEDSQRPDLNKIKAGIVSAIQGLRPAFQNGLVTNAQISDAYNMSRPKTEHITKEEVGCLLIPMQFRTTCCQEGNELGIIWEEFWIEQCCEEYGVPYSKPPLQSPSKAEREKKESEEKKMAERLNQNMSILLRKPEQNKNE